MISAVLPIWAFLSKLCYLVYVSISKIPFSCCFSACSSRRRFIFSPPTPALLRCDSLTCNKHMKRCSTSLIIWEMRISSAMRYYIRPVRMTVIKKIEKCWWGCGEKGTLVHGWWKCISVQSIWNTVWRFL